METYNRCLFKERKQITIEHNYYYRYNTITNYYSITITIQHSLSFWSKNADQKRKICPLEFLPQAVLRHLDIRRRIKLDTSSSYHVKNTERIKGQLIRTEPIKPTQENTDVNLHDYALLSHYLDVILKAHTTEEKK